MFKTALRSLTALLVSSIAYSAAALAEGKVALVIGNSAYVNATPLPNPKNDAADLGQLLQTMGFEVVSGIDLSKTAMEGKIREFVEKAEKADTTLFFYAGHGMQVNGKNYLIPVDAKLDTATALNFETIDVDTVIQYMSADDRVGIVLLDACRNNPLERSFRKKTRSTGGSGLAATTSDGNMLIAFATAPGDVALDGTERNSPFTTALLKHLPEKGRELRSVLTDVKADVVKATGQEQRPWSHDNLTTEIFLNGKGSINPEVRPDKDPEEIARGEWEGIKDLSEAAIFEDFARRHQGTSYGGYALERAKSLREDKARLAWESVRQSESVAELRAFIQQYPNSAYVALADERIEKLINPTPNPVDEAVAEWRRIRISKNPEVFEDFARKYPSHRLAPEALRKAADLRNPTRDTKAAWFVVSGSFPKGQRAKAAQRLRALRAAGFKPVLVDSDDYANLADGLLVVVIKAQDRDQAKGIEERVREAVGDAYVKEAF